MKMTSLLSHAIIAAFAIAPARATVIDAAFSGRVTSQAGVGATVGDAITGEFIYDTVTGTYSKFTVAGVAAAPGFASLASITPDRLTALYSAQISPLTTGGTVNTTFTLDLEGVNPFPFASAAALLTNAAQLATNVDLASSSFGYNLSNFDGTNVRRISANLAAINVATVPEPATFAVLGISLIGYGAIRRRA